MRLFAYILLFFSFLPNLSIGAVEVNCFDGGDGRISCDPNLSLQYQSSESSFVTKMLSPTDGGEPMILRSTPFMPSSQEFIFTQEHGQESSITLDLKSRYIRDPLKLPEHSPNIIVLGKILSNLNVDISGYRGEDGFSAKIQCAAKILNNDFGYYARSEFLRKCSNGSIMPEGEQCPSHLRRVECDDEDIDNVRAFINSPSYSSQICEDAGDILGVPELVKNTSPTSPSFSVNAPRQQDIRVCNVLPHLIGMTVSQYVQSEWRSCGTFSGCRCKKAGQGFVSINNIINETPGSIWRYHFGGSGCTCNDWANINDVNSFVSEINQLYFDQVRSHFGAWHGKKTYGWVIDLGGCGNGGSGSVDAPLTSGNMDAFLSRGGPASGHKYIVPYSESCGNAIDNYYRYKGYNIYQYASGSIPSLESTLPPTHSSLISVGFNNSWGLNLRDSFSGLFGDGSSYHNFPFYISSNPDSRHKGRGYSDILRRLNIYKPTMLGGSLKSLEMFIPSPSSINNPSAIQEFRQLILDALNINLIYNCSHEGSCEARKQSDNSRLALMDIRANLVKKELDSFYYPENVISLKKGEPGSFAGNAIVFAYHVRNKSFSTQQGYNGANSLPNLPPEKMKTTLYCHKNDTVNKSIISAKISFDVFKYTHDLTGVLRTAFPESPGRVIIWERVSPNLIEYLLSN